jgi:hypothetical protein
MSHSYRSHSRTRVLRLHIAGETDDVDRTRGRPGHNLATTAIVALLPGHWCRLNCVRGLRLHRRHDVLIAVHRERDARVSQRLRCLGSPTARV